MTNDYASVLIATQVFFGRPGGGFSSSGRLTPQVWLTPFIEGVSGAGLLAKKFDEVSRSQMTTSPRVKMAEQLSVASISAGESDPRVEEADSFRVAGKEAYLAKNYKLALQRLKVALEKYEAALPSVSKFDVVIETLGYLERRALIVDGDAKEYFRQVVATLPNAEPLDEYSQRQKTFAKIRKKLLRKKRGRVKITINPPGRNPHMGVKVAYESKNSCAAITISRPP